MKLSRKFFTSLFASSMLLTQANKLNADEWDYWAIKLNSDSSKGYDFYTVVNETGEATLRNTKCWAMPNYPGQCETGLSNEIYVDPSSGDLWFENSNSDMYSYSLETNTWTAQNDDWKGDYTVIRERSSLSASSDGTINIGYGDDILLKKKTNGEYHLGENSFVTKEENGKQNIWGQDVNGTKIPLNVQGSDFQIDGVSVQGQINTNKSNIKNLGEGVAGSTALTAALTALPQTSKESKLSCGVGTGAYSSRYAVGFGCASQVNERVDINAGGSYVFGGSKSYGGGTLDSGVVKAGFVFKLGELNKPTQISMKDKKVMETKILSLEENNNKIISQNKDLKQQNKSIISKNQNLENTVSTLMARLERLEKIALRDIKSQDLASIKD